MQQVKFPSNNSDMQIMFAQAMHKVSNAKLQTLYLLLFI